MMIEMTSEDLDPQPGDFDDELKTIDPRDVQILEGSADARVSLQLTVRGEDADRLSRIAASRGKQPSEVLTELLREAEHSA
jgi:hypothetical protein